MYRTPRRMYTIRQLRFGTEITHDCYSTSHKWRSVRVYCVCSRFRSWCGMLHELRPKPTLYSDYKSRSTRKLFKRMFIENSCVRLRRTHSAEPRGCPRSRKVPNTRGCLGMGREHASQRLSVTFCVDSPLQTQSTLNVRPCMLASSPLHVLGSSLCQTS